METTLRPDSRPFGELLTLLSQIQSTCIVRARDHLRAGELCFEAGELAYVRFGELHGGRALLALLSSQELEYEFDGGWEPETQQQAAPLVEHADVEAEGAAHLSASEERAISVAPDEEPTTHVESSDEPSGEEETDQSPAPAEERFVDAVEGEQLADLDASNDQHALVTTTAPERDEPTDPRLVLPSSWQGEQEQPRSLNELGAAADAGMRSRLEVLPEPQEGRFKASFDTLSRRLSEAERTSARDAVVDAGVAQWAALMLGDGRSQAREPARPVAAHGSLPPPPALDVGRFKWLAAAIAAPFLLVLLVWAVRGGPSDKVQKEQGGLATEARAPALIEGSAVEVPPASFAPTILLSVLVGANGAASDAQVIAPRAGLADYEARALKQVKSYRFQPALEAGKAVAKRMTLPVSFAAKSQAGAARALVIKGSDTIGASLAPRWARAFEKLQPGVHCELEALGSSTGFLGLLDGSAAIASSSRPVRADELAFASKLGIQLREVTAGYDGIAVILHRDNRIRSLDLSSVARIFAGRVARWGELGGRDEQIHVLGRPSYSGTHAFFKERVLKTLGADAAFGPLVDSVESAQEIVQRVAADVDAIAYVGLGQLAGGVQPLALQTVVGSAAVAPSATTVRDGSYPLARPLLLYFRGDSERDARAFIDYALSREGQAQVEQSGFVALAEPVQLALASEAQVPLRSAPTPIRLYFEEGSAVVTASSRVDLLAAAAQLRQNRRALVIGNADSRGDVAKNERLARRRAEAVVQSLKRLGVSDAPLDIQVASADRPLATNVTADGRKTNRRVDLLLLER